MYDFKLKSLKYNRAYYRTIGFLSSKLSGTSGVTYHKCDVLESSREQPLLAIAAAEPMNDLCPPPNMSFTRLEGIQSCHGT